MLSLGIHSEYLLVLLLISFLIGMPQWSSQWRHVQTDLCTVFSTWGWVENISSMTHHLQLKRHESNRTAGNFSAAYVYSLKDDLKMASSHCSVGLIWRLSAGNAVQLLQETDAPNERDLLRLGEAESYCQPISCTKGWLIKCKWNLQMLISCDFTIAIDVQ